MIDITKFNNIWATIRSFVTNGVSGYEIRNDGNNVTFSECLKIVTTTFAMLVHHQLLGNINQLPIFNYELCVPWNKKIPFLCNCSRLEYICSEMPK